MEKTRNRAFFFLRSFYQKSKLLRIFANTNNQTQLIAMSTEPKPESKARANRRAREKQNATQTETTAAPKSSAARVYEFGNPDDMLALSKELAKFIKENKLTTNVQGKEFVNVEGWQYAGSNLGLCPIVEHVINMSNEAQICYQAKVTIFNTRTNQTIGSGYAVCTNKESGKKFYQEFAIASMSQTRAIGKAYRNLLAWIIRAAGYEPTPAEEMEYGGNFQTQPTPTAPKIISSYSDEESQDKPETVPMSVSGGGVESTPAAPIQYATASQKEEIIRLLNHPLITRQEKTKMLLNINRLDEERATQAIAKLRKAIEDREGTSAVSA
jgi:hypothetical protein